MALPLARLASNPCAVVRGDPARPVHARQWFELPGRSDGAPELWCYTDRLSALPGERLRLHAIATRPRIDIEVRTLSRAPRVLLALRGVAAGWAETPADASVAGCGWPVVAEIATGADWPSGAYRITARPAGEAGPEADHLFVLRPAGRLPGRVLLVTSDATWAAYNDWGGSNAYEGIVDPDDTRFSGRLSNQRPLARGFVRLPKDAPRSLPAVPPPHGAPVSYPHMEWAWASWHSKKYASAGWASYERHFAHWAEAEGLPLAVATQADLHFRPEVLDLADVVVIVGHDEYWSWAMRDAIDDFVERGGRVARFAGNFLWQVRLEDEGRTQICHKYRAETDDPLRGGPAGHLTTTAWDGAETGRPGRATFGLDATGGLYAGWGGLAPRGAGGFTVYRPEHWAFAGAGLGYGDLLGAGGRVFGYEVDGLAHRIEGGLPFPEPADGLPEGLEILAMAPARAREDGFGAGPEALFVGDEDAAFVARLLHGRADPATLARIDRGSGMVVHFRRGQGEVFHAGTTEWVAGLMRGDGGVVAVTRNVLRRFLG